MAMRITNSTMGDRLLADLQRSYTRMSTTQESISTGKRVNRPSDDPTAAGTARLRTSDLEGVKRSQDSVTTAQSWLSASESGLSKVSDIMARANELAVKAANGSLNQNDRLSIATEIDQLAAAAKDAMNTKFGDAYVFSGTASDTAPYAAATGDAYQGNAGPVLREAGASVTLQINPQILPVGGGGATVPLTAQSVLGGGTAAADGRVLDTLASMSAHLRGGTPADLVALKTTDLQAIDANLKSVGAARSAVGAMTNRADAALSRLEDLEDVTTKNIDDLTGVDLARALMDYTSQQSAYQAALKVGAQIIRPSLVDFIS